MKNLIYREIFLKVVSSFKKLVDRSPTIQVVRRRRRLYLLCKFNSRFKVRQGKAKMKHKY